MTPTQSLQPVQGDTRAACINLPMRAECKHRNWYLGWRADVAPKLGGRIRTCKTCGGRIYEPTIHDGPCPGCGK